MGSIPRYSQALISRGPLTKGEWAISHVARRPLQDHELLVEVIASGVCQTDLHYGSADPDHGDPAVYYPRILGHEGSGYIREVGKAVATVSIGSPVLLSFSYCGTCQRCDAGFPSHCETSFQINFEGDSVFSDESGGSIRGKFFGQSSFAHYTVVCEKSVVNVSEFGLSRDDLRILAPLGCGLQTGSGTVTNVADAKPSDVIAIMGLGGVGLAAVMAARIRGCHTIIGLDRMVSRLDLAKTLGATHVINTTGLSDKDIIRAVREAARGVGPSISIDTTGQVLLVAAQIEYTCNMGKIIQVGTGTPDARVSIPLQNFMLCGKQYIGAVQGHSQAQRHVRQMIQWWRDGAFPLEKFTKLYDFKEFSEALKCMGDGSVVKPVLVW